MSANSKSFMDYVQEHERTWGTENYADRPNLVDILQAPVVVFWEVLPNNDSKSKEMRSAISLHQSLDELEQYFSRLIFRSSVEIPKRRVERIFSGGKLVRVRGVKVEFEVET